MKFQLGIIFMAFVSGFFNMPLAAEESQLPISFYVVRHGQTNWNVQRLIQGQTDIPLNQTGRDEAAALKLALQGITFAEGHSSNLQRAHDTALILTENHVPTLMINKDSRLAERNFGSWEGSFFSDYFYSSDDAKADVESIASVQQRVFEFLHEAAAKQQGGNNVLVVSHGAVMKDVIMKILDFPDSFDGIKIKNTAYMILTFTKDAGWKIKEFNGIVVDAPAVAQKA